MSPQLSDFKALVFDVYGTLCDWETGMYNALQPLISQFDEKPPRGQILTQLGSIELTLQAEHPTMLYSDILTHAYERLAQNLKVKATKDECVAFGQSIKDWPIFPDSSDALAELSKYYKLVVLSNVDRASFAFTREKLEAGKFTFDQICTAQDIGSYKPDPANFVYALKVIKDNYGIEKDRVLSTAQSLMHDHVPAQSLGMSSSYINRAGASVGFVDFVVPTFEFKTLGEMARAAKEDFEG
ncbi:HAD-like protein [Thelephora ganbajun]|uniref:HAD-like protein n=1 Tax=Thelephora ganbajun TaxID=370292 RepID=A0ACB6ZVL8_THEGA|nr:HAD-like protein [Thelephora ganbajun]